MDEKNDSFECRFLHGQESAAELDVVAAGVVVVAAAVAGTVGTVAVGVAAFEPEFAGLSVKD